MTLFEPIRAHHLGEVPLFVSPPAKRFINEATLPPAADLDSVLTPDALDSVFTAGDLDSGVIAVDLISVLTPVGLSSALNLGDFSSTTSGDSILAVGDRHFSEPGLFGCVVCSLARCSHRSDSLPLSFVCSALVGLDRSVALLV